MIKPAYKISVGSWSTDSTQIRSDGYLIRLRVDLSMNKVNIAEMVVRAEDIPGIAKGDEVNISLGPESARQVFAGVVESVNRDLNTWTIWAHSQMSALTRYKVNKLYEQQKGGDIVRDLAQIAGVTTGTVDNGLEYPVYSLGSNASMYDHILDLAGREGFDVFADANDKLQFRRYIPGTPQSLEYGKNILQITVEEDIPPYEGVNIFGESPAGHGQGKDAYSWLTKKEVKGSSGKSSGSILTVADPVLKDVSAASTVAESIAQTKNITKWGKAKVLGNNQIEPGTTIKVSGAPKNELNGTYKVFGIIHTLGKKTGYTSTIYWKEI